MDRSLWPEGVETHQIDMQRETSARMAATLRTRTDLGVMGIVSGLVVSVNSIDTSKVDVALGVAYAANGELLTVPTALPNNPLADYTVSTQNYVVLFYTEVQSAPEAHEDLGITLNTAATGSFRLKIYTVVQYNALLATSLDLTQDARDRACIIAIVTGGGIGTPLTVNSIQNGPIWTNITAISQPQVITGVAVTAIDQSTLVGNSLLALVRPISADPTLSWAAPTAVGIDTAGTPVSIPVDGIYTLTSTNGRTLTIQVVKLNLNALATNEILPVSSLYAQAVAHFSARDEQHRHMLGSGQPTSKNAHGLTFADIGGSTIGILQEHQDRWHANGIIKTTQPPLARSLLTLSLTRDGTHRVSVQDFQAADIAVVDGAKIIALNANKFVTFNDVLTDRTELYGIYMLQDGTVNHGVIWTQPEGGTAPQARVQIAPTGSDPFAGTIQPINISDNWQPGSSEDWWIIYVGDASNGTLALAADNTGSPGIDFTRYAVTRPNIASGPGVIRIFTDDGTRWIDLWVDATHWFVAGNSQVKIRIGAEPLVDTFLRLGYVVCHGTSHVLGFSQHNSESGSATNLISTRYFGTLTDNNIRDDGIFRLRDRVTGDLRGDGYILGFDIGVIVSGSLPVSGGILYLNGSRYEVRSAKIPGLSADGRYYIYANIADVMYSMTLVMQTTFTAPTNISIPLWAVDVVSGVVSAKYKIIRHIGDLDDRQAITIDPTNTIGQFTTLSSAVEYIRQLRAAGRIVTNTIHIKPGTITELVAVKAISNIRIEGEPGAIITSPTNATGGIMAAIDCAANLATGVAIDGITFDVSGATLPIGAMIWSDCIVANCRFTTTNAAANPRGVRVGDGVANIIRPTVRNCSFSLSTSALAAIERTTTTNATFALNVIGDGGGSILDLETTTETISIGTIGQTVVFPGAVSITQALAAASVTTPATAGGAITGASSVVTGLAQAATINATGGYQLAGTAVSVFPAGSATVFMASTTPLVLNGGSAMPTSHGSAVGHTNLTSGGITGTGFSTSTSGISVPAGTYEIYISGNMNTSADAYILVGVTNDVFDLPHPARNSSGTFPPWPFVYSATITVGIPTTFNIIYFTDGTACTMSVVGVVMTVVRIG